jgi:hypothetical protein
VFEAISYYKYVPMFQADVSTTPCTINENCTTNAICEVATYKCSCDTGYTENGNICEGILLIMSDKEAMNFEK